MYTLALETTAEPAGVALLLHDQVIEERRLARGTRRGIGLLPAASEILRSHLPRSSAVSIVAVSLGPGSFTGIRIGLAAGQSFAHFAGSRLVGVPTLDALAAETPGEHRRLAVAIDAGRGLAYGAIYDLNEKPRKTLLEPALLPVEELAGKIQGAAYVVGSAPRRYGDLFSREGLVLAPEESYPPRPATIGRLALQIAESREAGAEQEALEPIYLQPPHAKTKRERAEERAGENR